MCDADFFFFNSYSTENYQCIDTCSFASNDAQLSPVIVGALASCSCVLCHTCAAVALC